MIEFDSPENLMNCNDSVFYQMMLAMGISSLQDSLATWSLEFLVNSVVIVTSNNIKHVNTENKSISLAINNLLEISC